jgi:hypothetical protein
MHMLLFWKSSLHGDQRTSFCLCLLAVSICCTFLFIDVIVGWFVFSFLFSGV